MDEKDNFHSFVHHAIIFDSVIEEFFEILIFFFSTRNNFNLIIGSWNKIHRATPYGYVWLEKVEFN